MSKLLLIDSDAPEALGIDRDDPFETMGARLVEEAASKTSEVAGDGTATAPILAPGMIGEGLKDIGDPMAEDIEGEALADDALHAAPAAVESGAVAGAGVARIRASAALEGLDLDGDQDLGAEIPGRACEEPLPYPEESI